MLQSVKISMYLAKHVGRWSMQGSENSTTPPSHHGVARVRKWSNCAGRTIQLMLLVEMLTTALNPEMVCAAPGNVQNRNGENRDDLMLSRRVLEMLAQQQDQCGSV